MKGKALGKDEIQELRDQSAENIWHPFQPMKLDRSPSGIPIYVEGEGCRITDAEGNSYIDGFAGLGYKVVGYGRKEIADAAYEQMLELTSSVQYNTLATVPAIRLATKLAQITPGDLSRTAFVCGGSEANETAVKLAKHYQRLSGFGNRYKIIARNAEYHGFTHLTMSLGRMNGNMWTPFEPLASGVRLVSHPYCYRCPLKLEYPDCGITCAKELEKTILDEDPNLVAAFISTAISQNSPVAIPPPEYWPMIKSICDKYNILLIDDEVVCGFGRTGKMFGLEHWGIVPDIMTMAKGITSGYLPLAACISTPEISRKFEEGKDVFRNIATFGGLPACCAAALANIEIIENENLVEKTQSMGEYLSDKMHPLSEHPMVGDIRGTGLMWGVELVKDQKTKKRLRFKELMVLSRKLRE
ncbi:MAG: aspartate aminotransferase family protein, partial [Deltaproteobacteria bacterium]|nr:aspartate aminotransferase family protein [Deltaproteobacteria bacterium]